MSEEILDHKAVRVSAVGDVIKVCAWALGSMALGLCLTPLAFNGGKALFELSATKDFSGWVNKTAAWSGTAGLKDFFLICWTTVALLTLFPLTEWLRLGGSDRADVGGDAVPAIKRNHKGLLQALAGFLMSFGLFVMIGYVLVKVGCFHWATDGKAWHSGLLYEIAWALVVAAVVEMIFRYAVLGIFVRAMKVSWAIALAAVTLGGIRFILSGFVNADAVDGETLSAAHLAAPVFGGGNFIPRFVVVFLPWSGFGFLLGWVRWRTASMYLSSGLLVGWLLAETLFAKATNPLEVPGYLASGSAQTGIIPLVSVIVIGLTAHFIILRYKHGTD